MLNVILPYVGAIDELSTSVVRYGGVVISIMRVTAKSFREINPSELRTPRYKYWLRHNRFLLVNQLSGLETESLMNIRGGGKDACDTHYCLRWKLNGSSELPLIIFGDDVR